MISLQPIYYFIYVYADRNDSQPFNNFLPFNGIFNVLLTVTRIYIIFKNHNIFVITKINYSFIVLNS
jgi:hypothetical protein